MHGRLKLPDDALRRVLAHVLDLEPQHVIILPPRTGTIGVAFRVCHSGAALLDVSSVLHFGWLVFSFRLYDRNWFIHRRTGIIGAVNQIAALALLGPTELHQIGRAHV